MRFCAWLVVLSLVAACSKEAMVQKFTTPEEQAAAKVYVNRLRAHEYGAIETAIDPGLAAPSLHDRLVAMAGRIPVGEPTSVTLVGANRLVRPGSKVVNLTFEYGFNGEWLLINVAQQDKGGAKTIIGLNVVPESSSLAVANRFSLVGRTAAQYLILGAAIAATLLTVVALVTCLRTKHSGRTWPWALLTLVGVGSISVNWTTGQLDMNVVVVQLFSASVVSAPFGPWTVSVALPVGALVYLLMRQRLRAVRVDT